MWVDSGGELQRITELAKWKKIEWGNKLVGLETTAGWDFNAIQGYLRRKRKIIQITGVGICLLDEIA